MHFTIVTPTHNRRDYLPQALDSVRDSLVSPLPITFEHLVHDCGSTDGTADWLTSQSLPDHVRTLRSPARMPPGQARNHALRQATGDYILPLDDDDVLLQRTLHHFGYEITHGAGFQWLVSDFLRVDSQLRYLAREDYYGWRFDGPRAMLEAIFSSSHFIQGNVCYQRALFESVGGYDEQMTTAEDLDLYVRFLLRGCLPRYVPIISHLHRFHDRNASQGVDRDKHHADLTRLYDKYAPQLRAWEVELQLG